GQPLVYAVMAARRGADDSLVDRVVRSLSLSLERFRARPGELVAEVSRRIGVSERLVSEYYSSIRYTVDARVKAGIPEELRVLGLPECALPRAAQT
ncbi:MAG: MqnA/MqnD/SBP family protein, partial [Conexivisphaera sp.]